MNMNTRLSMNGVHYYRLHHRSNVTKLLNQAHMLTYGFSRQGLVYHSSDHTFQNQVCFPEAAGNGSSDLAIQLLESFQRCDSPTWNLMRVHDAIFFPPSIISRAPTQTHTFHTRLYTHNGHVTHTDLRSARCHVPAEHDCTR